MQAKKSNAKERQEEEMKRGARATEEGRAAAAQREEGAHLRADAGVE
jgi:hypothetical protein